MTTASILSECHDINSPFYLNTQIKSLEADHKQLEERLRERVQSLTMQINIPADFAPQSQSGLSTAVGESILQEHADLHRRYSNQLLARQVKLQQDAEIKELVKNYQKRIMDLRSMLVSKEAEIVYQTYQIKRDNIPKRENMQLLNNQLTEKLAIKKSLQQLKRIRVEVEALEHTIKMKSALSSKKRLLTDISILSISQDDKVEGLEILTSRKKKSNIERDKLLAKVTQILMDEVSKEERLKQALKDSKSEWQSVSTQHRMLCAKYTALSLERTKASAIVDTQNLLLQLQTQEDEYEDNKKNSIFASKDLNQQKSQPNKHSFRRNNLRDRRKELKKQN